MALMNSPSDRAFRCPPHRKRESQYLRRSSLNLRWQIGRNGDGEHFTLIAYGSTPERLLGCAATVTPRRKCRGSGR